jgi:hypothetical protein
MSTFDPSEPAILHDRTARMTVTWTGESASDFRRNAVTESDGTVAWRGMRFDGWAEVLGG